MAVKLLVDTDIGNDIDDAIALAYLLAEPECDLLGITTVSGPTVERAQLASALCMAAGQDVPIYPGAEEPLLGPQRQPVCHQTAGLAGWPHQTEFPTGEAVGFLRRTIRENPGEVTLLTLGPLTNVALLFRTDPQAACLLRALVMVAGVFVERRPDFGSLDWNVYCDAEAGAIVYRAPAPVHRSVGLDVTRQVTMSREEMVARFTAPMLQPVLSFAEGWVKPGETIYFHDPLAAVCAIVPKVCGFERGTVDVELASTRLRGYTFYAPSAEGPHEVALAVDPQRFFAQYFGAFEHTRRH